MDITEDIIQRVFKPEEVQEGLQPVPGTPFYTTPNDPADPQDCNRYPNSPWCGENPIRFDKPVGFEFTLVRDDCNLGIQVDQTLAYIALPTFQFVYRNPNCIPEPPPPPPPPREEHEEFPSIRKYSSKPYLIGYQSYFLDVLDADSYRNPDSSAGAYRETECSITLTTAFFGLYPDKINPDYPSTIPNMVLTFDVSYHELFNGVAARTFYANTGTTIDVFGFAREFRDNGGIVSGNPGEDESEWRRDLQGEIYIYISYPQVTKIKVEIGSSIEFIRNFKMIRNLLVKRFTRVNADSIDAGSSYDPISGFPLDYTRIRRETQYPFNNPSYYTELTRGGATTWIEPGWTPPPPPPPDIKKRIKDMDCCQDTNRLLRLILQRIGPLPASVPNSLVRQNSGTLRIQSLAQYIAYSIKQTNAQIGLFPQEIKISDGDLTQEGNQEKTVKLPNLSESIAEIIGMLLVLQSESNANLIATINAMIEAGSAKQAAILAGDYAAANAEFLGYKGKQIERKVAFTFKPGEQQLDKMLKSGEVKVKGFDNDDKNDLNDVLMPLLEMAAMYRAGNFRNLGADDPSSRLKSILNGAVELSKAVDTLVKTQSAADPNNPNEPKKTDWDAFVEDAERGFISQPGITDNLHPYNRPLDQRPKIREIGADTSESDGANT